MISDKFLVANHNHVLEMLLGNVMKAERHQEVAQTDGEIAFLVAIPQKADDNVIVKLPPARLQRGLQWKHMNYINRKLRTYLSLAHSRRSPTRKLTNVASVMSTEGHQWKLPVMSNSAVEDSESMPEKANA